MHAGPAMKENLRNAVNWFNAHARLEVIFIGSLLAALVIHIVRF